jgi:hypothetical protein
LGEPNPMTVRTEMMEGRSSDRARRMAASMAPTSVPSFTRSVCHP